MKHILVPTDFTITGSNAVFYAAELADLFRAKLTVVHVADRMEVTPTFGEVNPEADEVNSEAQNMLKTISRKILEKYQDRFEVETILVWGDVVEHIRKFIHDHDVDLAVIGVRESNFLTSKWDNSSVKELYRNAGCPVLGVKQHSSFDKLKKILIAYDGEGMLNEKMIHIITILNERFVPEFDFVTVYDSQHVPSELGQLNVRLQLDKINPELKYNFHILDGQDPQEVIKNLAKELKADLLMTMPKKKTFSLRDFFRQKRSTEMVLDGKVPVLTVYA